MYNRHTVADTCLYIYIYIYICISDESCVTVNSDLVIALYVPIIDF